MINPDKVLQTALRVVAEILPTLARRRADNRSDWITAGMVIHKVTKGHDEGLALWEEWSRQSPKFQEGECSRQWSTFDADRPDGVNLGTLRMWATQDQEAGEGGYDEPDEGTPVTLQELDKKLKKSNPGLSITKPPPSLDSLIAAAAHKFGVPESMRWYYRNANNREVLCVVRFDIAPGEKEIRPFYRVGERWAATKPDGFVKPLYNLPELPAADQVVVCEGEKSAEAAKRLGFVATTSGSAQSAGTVDWSPLAGKMVLIFPDNDESGRKYEQDVQTHLLAINPPATIKTIVIPDLPLKGDIANYTGTREELDHLIAQTPVLTKQDTIWKPEIIKGEDIVCRPLEWLWQNRMTIGGITVVAGKQGLGKSFCTMDLAASVTRGRVWPDGASCPQGRVLIIASEDEDDTVIAPRLIACGADMNFIRILPNKKRQRKDGSEERQSFKLTDIPVLEAALNSEPDYKMVIIDPVGSYMGGDVDAHRNTEVREILLPVKQLAARLRVAIILVAHLRKDATGSADDQISGTSAFTEVPRNVWHVLKSKKNKKVRLFATGKSNYCDEMPAISFTLEGTYPHTHVKWLEVINQNADQLVSESQSSRASPQSEEAEAWIKLSLSEGPRTAKELQNMAKEAGLSWRTIADVSAKLVKSEQLTKERLGYQGATQWVWVEPESE